MSRVSSGALDSSGDNKLRLQHARSAIHQFDWLTSFLNESHVGEPTSSEVFLFLQLKTRVAGLVVVRCPTSVFYYHFKFCSNANFHTAASNKSPGYNRRKLFDDVRERHFFVDNVLHVIVVHVLIGTRVLASVLPAAACLGRTPSRPRSNCETADVGIKSDSQAARTSKASREFRRHSVVA